MCPNHGRVRLASPPSEDCRDCWHAFRQLYEKRHQRRSGSGWAAGATSSGNQKGLRLSREFKTLLSRTFPTLADDDLTIASKRKNGPDLILSAAAQIVIGRWAVYIKNRERLNIWKALAQSRRRE
jgi:hypothetical protein